MWACISRARSASRRPRRSQRRTSLLDRPHDQADGVDQPFPLRAFLLQLAASLRRQAVVARAPIVFGRRPIRLDAPPILEAVQRRIEGTLLDLKKRLGALLDRAGDGIA